MADVLYPFASLYQDDVKTAADKYKIPYPILAAAIQARNPQWDAYGVDTAGDYTAPITLFGLARLPASEGGSFGQPASASVDKYAARLAYMNTQFFNGKWADTLRADAYVGDINQAFSSAKNDPTYGKANSDNILRMAKDLGYTADPTTSNMTEGQWSMSPADWFKDGWAFVSEKMNVYLLPMLLAMGALAIVWFTLGGMFQDNAA